jgi:hypothetical protein
MPSRSIIHKVVPGVGVFMLLLAAFGVSFSNVERFPLGAGVARAAFLAP